MYNNIKPHKIVMPHIKRYEQKKFVRVGDKIRKWVESKNRWSDELTVIELTPLKIIVEIPSTKNKLTFYRKHFIESDEFIFSSFRSLDMDPNTITENDKNDN
jgi:hypothetical protein